MNLKLTYEIIADICLYADGGYCQKCADDVAEGFKSKFPKIDLEKLKRVINKKMKEYYQENKERILKRWKK